jgi:hypothetical protein
MPNQAPPGSQTKLLGDALHLGNELGAVVLAARQQPAPLEMPQGRSAGPALRFEVAQ